MVAAMTVSGVLLAACLPPYEGPTDGRKVVIIGDSIVFNAGVQILPTFNGRGWQVSKEHGISVSTSEHMGSIAQAPSMGPEVVMLVHATADVNRVLLTANPADKPARRAENIVTMNTALDQLASIPCVVLVTASTGSTVPGFNAEAANHNAMLTAAAQSRTNTTWLDWSAWSAGHPEWFAQGDGLHLTDAGAVALADVMELTARSCGAW